MNSKNKTADTGGGIFSSINIFLMAQQKEPIYRLSIPLILKYFFIGGGVLALLNIGFGSTGGADWGKILKTIFFNGVAFTLFAMGNNWLSNHIAARFSWKDEPTKTFAISMVGTLIFTTIIWIFIVWLWLCLHFGYVVGGGQLLRNLTVSSLTFTIIITVMVSALFHGRTFLIGWRETHLEAEQLRREQMSARFEMLKTQVNPHFLFNSLNVLTTLVHKDADLAEEFIQKLSKVYRFTLETRDREVIRLDEELTQLESYIFLMKIRFGEGFLFDNKVGKSEIGRQEIPPLTLQMLLENALKHNQASKNAVLKIVLTVENGFLILKNNLQKKENVLDSSGVGLSNILSRYQILTGKKVEIDKTETEFIVRLPIIAASKLVR